MSPGKTVRIGLGNRRLTASLAANFGANVGSESCKAMFSSAESDFSWLNQQGLRSSNESMSNVAAFDAALNGTANNPDSPPPTDNQQVITVGADTGEQAQDSHSQPNDWDAITRSFTILRSGD